MVTVSRSRVTVKFHSVGVWSSAFRRLCHYKTRLKSELQNFSDQPVAESFGHGFGLRMNLEFLIDVLQMKVDRGGRNSQLCRGSSVVMAFNQQLQDSHFVRSQVVIGAIRRANIAK